MHESARFSGGGPGSFRAWGGRRRERDSSHTAMYAPGPALAGFRPIRRKSLRPPLIGRVPAPPLEEVWPDAKGAQPSNTSVINGSLRLNSQRACRFTRALERGSKPAGALPDPIIFLLFPPPVKATTRGGKEERQGGVITRGGKKHPRKKDQWVCRTCPALTSCTR